MSVCATSTAEIHHDIQSAKAGAQEYFVAVSQLEQVQAAASRILAGHSIPAMRDSAHFDVGLQKVVPIRVQIEFRMQHVKDLVMDRTTEEILSGLHRGEPFALRQMQRLVRECAEEVAFDALGFDSNPFVSIEHLRDAAE